ncbi:acetyl-CoA carboxylase biotin carboxylase subunit [bacterium]|nr:acetyl-CoA carboxylase biotin carboxylase subunit [bacterium]
MIKKILIANRGEIAVRVMRTARELGIATVAVYSEVDVHALHVQSADEAVNIGAAPASESYLNMDKLIDAAQSTGADAIHPGYGFLSENPDFAERVRAAGLIFIGPPADSMRLLGDKIASRKLAEEHKVPITRGAILEDIANDKVLKVAESIGFPIMIKATAGGGGKGMRVVHEPKELIASFEAARREAQSAFGNPTVYLEKYIENPRHIEFQIFCDDHGNAIHLGERECSIQRRHQKIIEESPSVVMTDELRKRMGAAAIKIVKAAGYRNAGTVEFLYNNGEFYFMEVNARLQVEHPVTEFVTGEDLVAWQIAIAAGEELPKKQVEIHFRGHAIECRIYAEDPANQYLPSSGKILVLEEPQSPGVRVDSGIRQGSDVSVYYDPILSKVTTYSDTRERAIQKMLSALNHYILLGVRTPIELLKDVLRHPEFKSGNLTTHFLNDHLPGWKPASPDKKELARALFAASQAAAASQAKSNGGVPVMQTPWQTLGSWEIAKESLS